MANTDASVPSGISGLMYPCIDRLLMLDCSEVHEHWSSSHAGGVQQSTLHAYAARITDTMQERVAILR